MRRSRNAKLPLTSSCVSSLGASSLDSTPPSDTAGSRLQQEIIRRFRAPLLRFFGRRVEGSEAEDLTQEVFLRLLRKRLPTIPQAATHAYIFKIAANLLRDRARRAATHQQTAHCALEETIEADLLAEIDAERVLIGRESLRLVLDALEELDERTRNIFLLFRLEGMRQRQIGEMYGMTAGAVEKRVLKASAHLAARLYRFQKREAQSE